MNRFKNRAWVESLENRQLLAVTLPNALGDFVGTVVYPSGTATIDLNVTKQKGASLAGVASLSISTTPGAFHGSINKRGIVHFSSHSGKFSASIVGTLIGDTIDGIFKYHSGKSHGTGTVTAIRD